MSKNDGIELVRETYFIEYPQNLVGTSSAQKIGGSRHGSAIQGSYVREQYTVQRNDLPPRKAASEREMLGMNCAKW